MKPIWDFVNRFGASVKLDENLIVKKENCYFLVDENLKKAVAKDFFYAGAYLGKIKGDKFFPSFILLKMIAKEKANKIIVDKKTEWLFICGRDVFKRGIIQVSGAKRRDAYALILNQRGECLGFGKILCNLDEKKCKVAVKNVLDIGDFLRRETRQI
ncbi:MAG: hypothetical protein QW386_02575 [Candidatus Bathyarchaeia archaeon]